MCFYNDFSHSHNDCVLTPLSVRVTATLCSPTMTLCFFITFVPLQWWCAIKTTVWHSQWPIVPFTMACKHSQWVACFQGDLYNLHNDSRFLSQWLCALQIAYAHSKWLCVPFIMIWRDSQWLCMSHTTCDLQNDSVSSTTNVCILDNLVCPHNDIECPQYNWLSLQGLCVTFTMTEYDSHMCPHNDFVWLSLWLFVTIPMIMLPSQWLCVTITINL